MSRLLVCLLLVMAPIAPGYWRISLAERSEQHSECEPIQRTRVELKAQPVQPPPPPVWQRARRRRQRRSSIAVRRFHAHKRISRSSGQRPTSRRVLYEDSDDPDDPSDCRR